jgi:hypothetical protein
MKEEKKDPEERERPVYRTPKIQVMTEEEVLRTFQVTHATVSWWVL